MNEAKAPQFVLIFYSPLMLKPGNGRPNLSKLFNALVSDYPDALFFFVMEDAGEIAFSPTKTLLNFSIIIFN